MSPRHLKISCLKNPAFLSHKLLSLLKTSSLLRNLYQSTLFHILSGRKRVGFITKNSFKSAPTFFSPLPLILSIPLSYLTYYSHLSLVFLLPLSTLSSSLDVSITHISLRAFKLNDFPSPCVLSLHRIV